MCSDCGWKTFVEDAQELLCGLDELPDRAEDFADGVRERVEGMVAWAQEEHHVTPWMIEALERMATAVGRWIR